MKLNRLLPALLIAAFGLIFALLAQNPPALAPAYSGSVMVSGKVAPGAGPVSIFDLSYPAKTKLGDTHSVDANGNFAAVVKPALVAGHKIIAVDTHGTASAPVVVVNRPTSPARPN